MILTTKLTKRFSPTKTRITALNNVSFSISKGERVALLGANGSGKTTLLRILATGLLPDSGSASICDHEVGQDDMAIKTLVGFVSNEDRSFYWRLTGRQNLAFYAALYGFSPRDSDEKINKLLTHFNIDFADNRFSTYSSGMKCKMALLKVLLHDPAILLLDEPTKSLDLSFTKNFHDYIQSHVPNETTLILATHDIQQAKQLCECSLVLKDGQLEYTGPLDTLCIEKYLP